MALAHIVKNRVEAAYRRGDLLEKQRGLMDDWAAFCTGQQSSGGDGDEKSKEAVEAGGDGAEPRPGSVH